MACAVRAAWATLSAATSGGTVDHEALAYQGVETRLGEPDQPGPAHDVPDQEPVILAHWPGSVVVRADEAAQPPVGHVQGVGVAGAGHAQAGGRQPGPELVTAIDSNMAARPVVVAVGEGPAHPLREPARDADREGPARSQHSRDLGDGIFVTRAMAQNLGREHGVAA